VSKFIDQPAAAGGLTDSPVITASGPSLPALLSGLKKLCDMRCALDAGDKFKTRYADIEYLKDTLK
jgi:hypothetical protein